VVYFAFFTVFADCVVLFCVGLFINSALCAANIVTIKLSGVTPFRDFGSAPVSITLYIVVSSVSRSCKCYDGDTMLAC